MEPFRKLFVKSALRQEAEQKIKDVEREGKPFDQLGSNLIHAVCEATSDVYCTPEKLAEPIHEFLLRQEFLYFVLNITQSLAHSQKFTPSERADLYDILLRVLDASMGEIPEAYRSESREVAMHNANAPSSPHST